MRLTHPKEPVDQAITQDLELFADRVCPREESNLTSFDQSRKAVLYVYVGRYLCVTKESENPQMKIKKKLI